LATANRYPRRLIEVDLPIARISTHARREKSIRHGHISTLHIWWARRPLAACRAVILAALWPDPAPGPDDPPCPPAFVQAARKWMLHWANDCAKKASAESFRRLAAIQKDPAVLQDPSELRRVLLDFIADFANWDNSTDKDYLDTSRALVQAAHEALGGEPGTRPLVVDPFAGGGSIPLEALRVGADAFASDLNPVAVLLNKVVLEYIPKYGQRLADEVRKWGAWIKEQAEKELAQFYPKHPDGSTPIAYLWARTIRCEGPGCAATIPLMRSLRLSGKGAGIVAMRVVSRADQRNVDIEIVQSPKAVEVAGGTIRRSSCTCPLCGYTTPAQRVRAQFIRRNGGADDARLMVVVSEPSSSHQARFRKPTATDEQAFGQASECLRKRQSGYTAPLVPDEPLPYLRSIFNVNLLGIDQWGKLFNRRQALALVVLVEKTAVAIENILKTTEIGLATAAGTCLGLVVDRCADYWSSLAVWAGDFVAHTFGRQALGIIWDYAEVNGLSDGTGSYAGAVEWVLRVLEREATTFGPQGHVERASACEHPLPDDCAHLFCTDPPYYDAVPYADLSDFFYVWLKRSVGKYHKDLFKDPLTQKRAEVVQLSERNPLYAYKTRQYFEDLMKTAMSEGRRILAPSGAGVVVFAHKTTAGWESQIKALIEAGWIVTGSWPIDTERPGRLRANNAAALASSIHLVCRARENPDGSLREDDVGDWRDVLAQLPKRIHEWMPRLAKEGIVGADAIFACLGPALEIFSRYSRVEKASGERVELKEYLEHVWAAVSTEALSVIFEDADAAGLEADARLTAMWLWTVGARKRANGGAQAEEGDEHDEGEDDEEVGKAKKPRMTGFALEFDAARKIAQGLGVHLEKVPTVVEVKGETARLLPVAERTRYLFGKDAASEQTMGVRGRSRKPKQWNLFDELEAVDAGARGTAFGEIRGPQAGATVLDRVHQAMILFAAGRGEAVKRFLVEDGAGKDSRFWKLAQALSALYPAGTDEKRWVDGVLARKKRLGL
jgi:adenine-specific DNA methylase